MPSTSTERGRSLAAHGEETRSLSGSDEGNLGLRTSSTSSYRNRGGGGGAVLRGKGRRVGKDLEGSNERSREEIKRTALSM